MITEHAEAPAGIRGGSHAAILANGDVAADWWNERGVFAPEEIGWLGDEARRELHRQCGSAEDFHVLHDVHRGARGFALLAAHPRLLQRATALLDGPAEVAQAFVQCGSLVRPRLPVRDDIAIVVVPLGWRPEAPLGGISLGTRPDSRARFEWPFVAVYRRQGAAPPPVLADDCLWPAASIVAG